MGSLDGLDADVAGSLMPAVTFYFAKVDAEDTTFQSEYARNDYQVISFSLGHEEGEFASLEIAVKNERGIGLLAGPVWLWFSWSIDGNPAVPLFFGRLTGIPTSIFDEKVTLEFVARPADYNDQKAVLAESLRVLPHYDPVFLDENSRTDPDVVLEGYTKAWHIDRVTHDVTASEVLLGEDGVLEFQPTDMLYQGLELDLSQIPLTSVAVDATFQWTQMGQGQVDLTSHIVDNWPNEEPYGPGVITSFTLQENDWPQPLANLGENWTVAASAAVPVHELEILSKSDGLTLKVDWGTGGGQTTTTVNLSDQYVKAEPPGSVDLHNIVTEFTYAPVYNSDPDGPTELVSVTVSSTWSDGIVPLHHLKPLLVAGYNAERPRKEIVRFTLTADVQPIVTLPGDDEALTLSLNSESLNEPIDLDDDSSASSSSAGDFLPPIRDPRRRSYIVTERGELSLQHLIALAKANLVRRSRAVKVTFPLTVAATLANIPNISLRKNARIYDPRMPDGEALGKIISYTMSLDGNVGRLETFITIGCAIGRGGEVTAVGGNPIYVDDDYVEDDYQEREGETVLFDTSVGYTPPLFNPGDDGLDFLAGLSLADVIEESLTVENPPATQRPLIEAAIEPFKFGVQGDQEARQAFVDARTEAVANTLEAVPTAARFKLKSMKKTFEVVNEIDVTQLKIPTMIDLEASGSV